MRLLVCSISLHDMLRLNIMMCHCNSKQFSNRQPRSGKIAKVIIDCDSSLLIITTRINTPSAGRPALPPSLQTIHNLLDICWKIGHKKDEAHTFPERSFTVRHNEGIFLLVLYTEAQPWDRRISVHTGWIYAFCFLIEIQRCRKLTVGIWHRGTDDLLFVSWGG